MLKITYTERFKKHYKKLTDTEKKQFKYKLAVFAVQNKKTACSKAFLPNLRKPHGDSNLCKEFLGKNIKFSSIHYDNGAEFLRKIDNYYI